MSDDAVRYRVLVMRQPGFDPALLPHHAAFLTGLRAQGLLELAGGFDDRSGGAHLPRGVADPRVVGGASTAHVRGWRAH